MKPLRAVIAIAIALSCILLTYWAVPRMFGWAMDSSGLWRAVKFVPAFFAFVLLVLFSYTLPVGALRQGDAPIFHLYVWLGIALSAWLVVYALSGPHWKLPALVAGLLLVQGIRTLYGGFERAHKNSQPR